MNSGIALLQDFLRSSNIEPQGRWRHTGTEADRKNKTQRQTGRQADRQTDRQAGSQTDRDHCLLSFPSPDLMYVRFAEYGFSYLFSYYGASNTCFEFMYVKLLQNHVFLSTMITYSSKRLLT